MWYNYTGDGVFWLDYLPFYKLAIRYSIDIQSMVKFCLNSVFLIVFQETSLNNFLFHLMFLDFDNAYLSVVKLRQESINIPCRRSASENVQCKFPLPWMPRAGE